MGANAPSGRRCGQGKGPWNKPKKGRHLTQRVRSSIGTGNVCRSRLLRGSDGRMHGFASDDLAGAPSLHGGTSALGRTVRCRTPAARTARTHKNSRLQPD